MSAFRLKWWLAAFAIGMSPGVAGIASAQVGGAPTLGEIIAAAEYARLVTHFASVAPAADHILERNIRKLAEVRVLTVTLSEVERRASDRGVLARAKETPQRFQFGLPENFVAVLDTIVMVMNGEMRAWLIEAVSREELERIRLPFDKLADSQLAESLDASARVLNRFERMYGPGSVQLNIVETGINYIAQWLPWFGVDQRKGPRPLELVSSWSPMYFAYASGKAVAVSVFEAGIRVYLFAPGWGTGRGPAAVLRPGYVAGGLAFSGGADATLRNPFAEGARSGFFVAWGGLKVAFLGGGEQRLMLSRQLRFVPLLF